MEKRVEGKKAAVGRTRVARRTVVRSDLWVVVVLRGCNEVNEVI